MLSMQNFEIIIGTYEEFLLGYKVTINNDKASLVQSFADKSHSGPLKCVAVQGYWIATGATDDRIFIYDMRTRKQSQILLTHDGTINALAFTPDESHLLSGGDDGRMIATRLKTWITEGMWQKAHNGAAVTHITCHPSGKLALTLGSDLVLRTWNLVKGRVAYKTNLKSRNTLGYTPDCLAWSTSGEHFSITGQRVIEIWSIKTADLMLSIKTNAKPICLTWLSDAGCLIGLEDGKILWLDINEKSNEVLIEAHSARVKAICHFKDTIITASSAGEIKIWSMQTNKRKLKELAVANIGCRPTCLNVLDLEQFGADYVLTKTIAELQEEPVKVMPKQKTPQRGVVKIEYENDDANEVSNKSSEDDEDEILAEQQNVKESDNTSDEDASDTDDEIYENEPQIRLPKSRKHKQHILNTQNKAKKAKMEKHVQKNASKNAKNVKNQDQQSNKQYKVKQKLNSKSK